MKIVRTDRIIVLWLLLMLTACSSNYSAPVGDVVGGPGYVNSGRTHRVNGGETLYAIAWIYDLDYTRLASLNDIASPYTIYAGQILNVDPREVAAASAGAGSSAAVSTPVTITRSAPVSSAPSRSAAPSSSSVRVLSSGNDPLTWGWPASGALVGRFVNGSDANKGIDIAGRQGEDVTAAADGEVVYAGRGLLRYGDMIILKHNERFLSAYAHNSRLLVSEGEKVGKGQRIAELGSTGIDREMLHFEIRQDGKPVNPLDYLPAR